MYIGLAFLLLPSIVLGGTVVNLPVTTCDNTTIRRDISVALGNTQGTSRVIQEATTCSFVHICCADDPKKGKAIKFRLHKEDNDPENVTAYDRQRLEIYLHNDGKEEAKGKLGDTMRYTWLFKLEGVQASDKFYHIFQLKTQDKPPIMTLTLDTEQQFHLRLRVNNVSDAKKENIGRLDQILEKWVAVTVTAVIKSQSSGGKVTVTVQTETETLKPVTVANTMLSSSWGTFIRPKWGLYRSIEGTPSTSKTQQMLLKNLQIIRV